jgi:hypothetical protein
MNRIYLSLKPNKEIVSHPSFAPDKKAEIHSAIRLDFKRVERYVDKEP